MPDKIIVRRAKRSDSTVLSNLAIRSKAHWGYSHEFIESCRAELTVNEAKIEDPVFVHYVAEAGGSVLGFYSIEKISRDEVELDALFVEPESIGKGVGRCLIEHAIGVAQKEEAASILIQSDPHAVDFYVAAGAEQVGQRPSASVSGRTLPLLRIRIRKAA